jgi:hypothetical protein
MAQTIKFTDGVSIVISGPYRVLHLDDGYYVTGHEILIPCDSYEEAEQLANDYRRGEEASLMKGGER